MGTKKLNRPFGRLPHVGGPHHRGEGIVITKRIGRMDYAKTPDSPKLRPKKTSWWTDYAQPDQRSAFIDAARAHDFPRSNAAAARELCEEYPREKRTFRSPYQCDGLKV